MEAACRWVSASVRSWFTVSDDGWRRDAVKSALWRRSRDSWWSLTVTTVDRLDDDDEQRRSRGSDLNSTRCGGLLAAAAALQLDDDDLSIPAITGDDWPLTIDLHWDVGLCDVTRRACIRDLMCRTSADSVATSDVRLVSCLLTMSILSLVWVSSASKPRHIVASSPLSDLDVLLSTDIRLNFCLYVTCHWSCLISHQILFDR